MNHAKLGANCGCGLCHFMLEPFPFLMKSSQGRTEDDTVRNHQGFKWLKAQRLGKVNLVQSAN